MKKIASIALLFTLVACGPLTKESGTNDDGMKPADQNGALQDSAGFTPSPGVDSAMGDHRVDTQQRDSSTHDQ